MTTWPTASGHNRRTPPWVWVLGVVCAVVALGPALGPGSLFNLDLVLPPEIPVPSGVWGLGPELPRRVPLWLPVAWLSPLTGALVPGKVLLCVPIVIGFVGMYRLVSPQSQLAAVGAGLLYALNPFMLTRLGVGHVMIALTMALLPWVYPTLLRPADDVRRTLLAASALAFTGFYGGIIGILIAGAGALRGRQRTMAVAGVIAVAQLPWLLPGIVVAVTSQTLNLEGSLVYPTNITLLAGPGQLAAGHGFWQNVYQVGWPAGPLTVLIGFSLIGLAIFGMSSLPKVWRGPAGALALFGFVVAFASALSPLRRSFTWLTEGFVLAPFRESQRFLPLFLVWLVFAAALGSVRVATRIQKAASALSERYALVVRTAAELMLVSLGVMALVLSANGLWGIGGQLRGVDIPEDWSEIRTIVNDEPGTVLVLPWNLYFDLDFGGTVEPRRVLNPLPIFLGGDVLTSSDTQLSQVSVERADPREGPADEAIRGLLERGEPIAARLADLGVRWVVLLHEVDWERYASVRSEPGLRNVVLGDTADLLEVEAWPGVVVARDGSVLGSRQPLAPLLSIDSPQEALWLKFGQDGWRRGGEPLEVTGQGVLAVPGGNGLVWFVPSALIMVGYVTFTLALLWAAQSLLKERLKGRPLLPRRKKV